jgi:hypothetical protein
MDLVCKRVMKEKMDSLADLLFWLAGASCMLIGLWLYWRERKE